MNRTAVITGAGTGIGKAVATALLRNGWNTVFVGRRQALLDQAVADAAPFEARALAAACDITQEAEVDALFETSWTHSAVSIFCSTMPGPASSRR